VNVLDAQGGVEAENYHPLEELTCRLVVISSKDDKVLVKPARDTALAKPWSQKKVAVRIAKKKKIA
jgi:hypothetical protein